MVTFLEPPLEEDVRSFTMVCSVNTAKYKISVLKVMSVASFWSKFTKSNGQIMASPSLQDLPAKFGKPRVLLQAKSYHEIVFCTYFRNGKSWISVSFCHL